MVPMLRSERHSQESWVMFGKKVKSLFSFMSDRGGKDSWSIIQLQRLEVIS